MNNYLNLPEAILWDDGRRIEYQYSAAGIKIKASYFKEDGVADYVHDYDGGFEYDRTASKVNLHYSIFP